MLLKFALIFSQKPLTATCMGDWLGIVDCVIGMHGGFENSLAFKFISNAIFFNKPIKIFAKNPLTNLVAK